jgi:hypothetical protein
MKRSLDGNKRNEKIVNFRRQDDNELQENITKKTNKEEIEEINNVIYDIFGDSLIDIMINIDTKNKEIYINKKYINNKKEDNRKFKYRDKNLEHFLDFIYDDLLYNDINTLSVYLNKQNILVDKTEWKKQLLNEISYTDLLEEELKKEDELINLLECNLKCLNLSTKNN